MDEDIDPTQRALTVRLTVRATSPAATWHADKQIRLTTGIHVVSALCASALEYKYIVRARSASVICTLAADIAGTTGVQMVLVSSLIDPDPVGDGVNGSDN